MRIVMAAGGTAGHLFPALEVARALRREGHDIIFLGVFGAAAKGLEADEFDFTELPARGLQGKGVLGNMRAIGSLIRSSFQARSFLGKHRPAIVVGFGGYGSFPAVCGGLSLGIPTVIHEQNVWPGRANRLLAPFVKKVAISFGESNSFLKARQIVLTGCPVKGKPQTVDHDQLLRKFSLYPERNTILVFGGSQGSRRINSVLPQSIRFMAEHASIQVVHIGGHGSMKDLEEAYQNVDVPFQLFEFYQPMSDLYPIADVVVCRAGAATVTELALFQRPAVLVPYPFAQGHQTHNALVLVKEQLGRLMPDKELTPKRLAQEILDLLGEPPTREKFEALSQKLNINDATGKLTREILTTV